MLEFNLDVLNGEDQVLLLCFSIADERFVILDGLVISKRANRQNIRGVDLHFLSEVHYN